MKPVLPFSIQTNLFCGALSCGCRPPLAISHRYILPFPPLSAAAVSKASSQHWSTGTQYSAKTHTSIPSALGDMDDSIQPHNHPQSRSTTVQGAVPQATLPSMTTPNDPPAAQTHSPGACALVPSDAPTLGRVEYPFYRLRWNIVSLIVSCFLWEKVLHQYFCLGIIEKAHSQRTGQV